MAPVSLISALTPRSDWTIVVPVDGQEIHLTNDKELFDSFTRKGFCGMAKVLRDQFPNNTCLYPGGSRISWVQVVSYVMACFGFISLVVAIRGCFTLTREIKVESNNRDTRERDGTTEVASDSNDGRAAAASLALPQGASKGRDSETPDSETPDSAAGSSTEGSWHGARPRKNTGNIDPHESEAMTVWHDASARRHTEKHDPYEAESLTRETLFDGDSDDSASSYSQEKDTDRRHRLHLANEREIPVHLKL
jgi:hypothetical protein